MAWSGDITPFGDKEDSTGLEGETVKYTGKTLDPDTGLYYFNARWYDQNLGRFITEDPIKHGNNWYVYCRNNPIGFIDPTGLQEALVEETVKQADTILTDPAVQAGIAYTAKTFFSGVVATVLQWASVVGPVLLIQGDVSYSSQQMANLPLLPPNYEWIEVDGTYHIQGIDGQLYTNISQLPENQIKDGITSETTIPEASAPNNTTTDTNKDDKVRVVNGRKPINSKYAGSTHPSGVEFTEEGFPDFSPYSKVTLEIEGLTGNYKKDSALANQVVGFPRTPDGYTWHHNEDGVTMQLVPSDIHREVRHTGGAAIIRNQLRE